MSAQSRVAKGIRAASCCMAAGHTLRSSEAVEATTERQQLEEEHARALAALSAKLMATELKAHGPCV